MKATKVITSILLFLLCTCSYAATTFKASWNAMSLAPDLGASGYSSNSATVWVSDMQPPPYHEAGYLHTDFDTTDKSWIGGEWRVIPPYWANNPTHYFSDDGGTVEFWFKTEGDQTGILFSLEGFDGGGWVRHQVFYRAVSMLHNWTSAGIESFNYPWFQAAIPMGQWTHLAFAYDYANMTLKVYINGQLDVTFPFTNPAILFVPTTVELYIGGKSPNADVPNTQVGDYDEFRVYDAVLTDTEILDRYNAGRTIAGMIPEILTAFVPVGFLDMDYSETLVAQGGVEPYQWSISSDSLPPGLSLDSVSGVISGVPTQTGLFTFTVMVEDSQSESVQKELSLEILPDILNTITFMANYDNNTLKVDIFSYSSPGYSAGAGTVWQNSGRWGGSADIGTTVPAINYYGYQDAGTYVKGDEGTIEMWIKPAFDSEIPHINSQILLWAAYNFNHYISLTINHVNDIQFTGREEPGQTVSLATDGVSYDAETWHHVAATWKAGVGAALYFDGQSVDISTSFTEVTQIYYPSSPMIIGSRYDAFWFEGDIDAIVIYDQMLGAAQIAANYNREYPIVTDITLFTTAVKKGAVDFGYSQQLDAVGGTEPYTWQKTSGELPPGLSLNPNTGEIHDTPTAVGTYNYTIRVTDADLNYDEKTYLHEIIDSNLTWRPAVEINHPSSKDKAHKMQLADSLASGDNWQDYGDTIRGTHEIVSWYDTGDTLSGVAAPADTSTVMRLYRFMDQYDYADKETVKIIEFGWDSPTTAYLKANIATMEQLPFEGVAINPEIPGSVGSGDGRLRSNVFGDVPLQYSDFATAISNLQQTNFNKFTDNFVSLTILPGDVDWFDDFSQVISNMALVARFAQETGMKGILLDLEEYGDKDIFTYSSTRLKYTSTKTFTEYWDQIELRATEITQAMNAEYPDITIFLPVGYAGIWRDYEKFGSLEAMKVLLPAFIDGMVIASSEPTIFYEGTENSYGYKLELEFVQEYQRDLEGIQTFSRYPDLVRPKYNFGFAVFLDRGTSGFGQFHTNPAEYDQNYFTPEEYQNSVRYAQRYSEKYMWIYTEHISWWPLSSIPDDYINAQAEGRKIGIHPTALANGIAGVHYSEFLHSDAGYPPCTWSATPADLPDGLNLNSASGEISGFPLTPGAYNFQVQVTDSTAITASDTVTIEIVNVDNIVQPAIEITWNSIDGHQYQIFWSPDGLTNWQPCGPVLTGTGSVMKWYDVGDSSQGRSNPGLHRQPQRFYKIEAP